MSLQVLFFDLGNVLVELDFDRAYRAAAALRGGEPDDIRRLLAESDLAAPYERGEIDSAEFHRAVSDLLGIDVGFDEFARLWGDMFSERELIATDWIAALGEKNRLALLSNTNELHFEAVRQRYPVVELFPEAVLSYRVRSMKPSPAIYEAAVEAAGCAPGECFFVDDRPENVEGARAAGLDAELFRGQSELEEQLRARGVHW
jgi:glucose-1-phosphatase